jgi:hypothetical protein
LSIADQDRNYIEEAIRSKEYTSEFGTTSIQWMVYRRRKKQIPQEVISLYMLTRDPRPDLYALICGLEIMLHKLLKCVLQSAYGDDWWRKGIPSDVRKGCQNRREDDEDPVPDPYQYTNFIDIKAIIDKQWAIFSAALPNDLAANRPEMLSKLQRVNGIRNRVMHPVKEIGGYEEDYKFLRAFLADCDEANWRLET